MVEFFQSLNWVDLLVIILAIRIIYISIKTGFLTEFIKTLGTVFAVFVAFHYYVKLAALIDRLIHFPEPVLHVLSFLSIWLLVSVAFKFFRDGLFQIFTIETISLVDKWGAVIVSIARFFLTISMALFVLLLTKEPYLKHVIYASFSKKYVLAPAPRVYHRLTTDVVARFFPKEKVNPAVFEHFTVSGKD